MTSKSVTTGSVGYKFPEALLKTPRCFIALSGLDVRNNAVHRLVWDEFTSGGRRSERKPVLYKNFPADHIYPKCCQNVRKLTVLQESFAGFVAACCSQSILPNNAHLLCIHSASHMTITFQWVS